MQYKLLFHNALQAFVCYAQNSLAVFQFIFSGIQLIKPCHLLIHHLPPFPAVVYIRRIPLCNENLLCKCHVMSSKHNHDLSIQLSSSVTLPPRLLSISFSMPLANLCHRSWSIFIPTLFPNLSYSSKPLFMSLFMTNKHLSERYGRMFVM